MTIIKRYHLDVEDGEIVGEPDTTTRFALTGITASGEDLRKSDAGDKLAQCARKHMERTGESFSDSLRVAMHINPELTRAYFRQ